MKKMLSGGFKMFGLGAAKPVSPITCLSISNFQEACHCLQAGRSIQKIVIETEKNALVKVCPRKKAGTLCSPEASYLIVGGTGSHGRNITSRLAEKGAQRIIVISRTGSKDQGVGMPVRELSANGATVVVYQCDVSSKEEVEGKLVSKLPHIPPVRGVIYGVMVLRDTSFEHMSYSEYDAVVKPKVAGVWKIHHAFLGLNCDLDLFITLSSIASLVGNRGQAAYAAGGTFMSAFGHNRNSVGLPCTTIDLGPVQGIGYLAENEQRKTDVADTLSVDWIDDTELHRLLAAATTGDLANTCQHHCITGLGALQSMTVKKK
ncbi:polyketide synthase [Histoplasma capsulatum G186AR]|uniref:Polyketide synthase n=1 Tax=Ajellomyces capsulatus TaxID=5037 RepID=A0A8H7YVN7_AJECA|nr:polyketide synthase [Histoplasma capsulatum]QSS68045.1 polyketide synthase [Histoplasma capsulatum G186AR]